jgi:signal transduction histidine kinase
MTDDWNSVQVAVQQAVGANAVKEASLSWDGAPLTALITPLKHDSNVVGAMLLAKSHDELAQVEDNLITILVALGGLGLIGSFLLGFVFTRNALSPLQYIIHSVEGTHLNKLEGKVKLSGNPNDEMVVLANRYNEMLSRINQMSLRQKEFIANASHELRTPLTRAILSLDSAIMENPSLPIEIKEAKHDLWDLNRLLEQLLILGQMKEGVLPKGTSDIKEVTDTVIKRYDNELQISNISITTEINTFSVPVPEDYFSIVLSNIISNAIKYSPKSSTIFIQADAGSRTLLVRDAGVGMTEDELAQLFERFYRGKSVRHTTRGYGLGLSLVKEICDEYKIRIDYQSEKGKGTTVTMSFST